jgi:hypothetical protein
METGDRPGASEAYPGPSPFAAAKRPSLLVRAIPVSQELRSFIGSERAYPTVRAAVDAYGASDRLQPA